MLTTIFLQDDERILLLQLLGWEIYGSVHVIVTAPQMQPTDKTKRIVNQLSFCFELRAALTMTTNPCRLELNDTAFQYLARLLEMADKTLMDAQMLLEYRRLRPQLEMKLVPNVPTDQIDKTLKTTSIFKEFGEAKIS